MKPDHARLIARVSGGAFVFNFDDSQVRFQVGAFALTLRTFHGINISPVPYPTSIDYRTACNLAGIVKSIEDAIATAMAEGHPDPRRKRPQ